MNVQLMRPFAPEMADMMNWVEGPIGEISGDNWVPSMDIEETEKEFVVRTELPGVDKGDVHVSLTGDMLSIKGEKKYSSFDAKKHRHECTYGGFIRSVRLPHVLGADKISAKLKDGVLEVRVVKMEQAKDKDIEISIS